MQPLKEKENIDVKEEVTSSIDSSPTTDVIDKAEEVALEVGRLLCMLPSLSDILFRSFLPMTTQTSLFSLLEL